MKLSPLNVIAWIHPGSATSIPYQAPRLRLLNDTSVAVEWNGGSTQNETKVTSETFQFFKCLRADQQPISACSRENYQLVEMALEGHNTACIFMAVGGADSSKLRKDIMHQLINRLGIQLAKVNTDRKKKSMTEIQLEYAYVGIVDNCCYDLRLGCRIENAVMMSKGINQCMKHVNHVDTIWSRVKEGTLVPFVLKIRLTDEAQFMGHLTIVDLLQPEFQRPPMLRPAASIYCSFEQLRSTIELMTTKKPTETMSNIDNYVLAKLLLEHICGLGQTLVYAHYNESLHYDLDEALESLRFSQTLQMVRCLAVSNKPDVRVNYYRNLMKKFAAELEKKKETHEAQLAKKNIELTDAQEQLEIQRSQIKELQKKHDQLVQEEEDDLEFVWSVPIKNVKNQQVQTSDQKYVNEGPMSLARLREIYDLRKTTVYACELQSRILELERKHFEATISLCGKDISKDMPSARGDTVGRSNEFDVSMQSLQHAQSEAEKRVKIKVKDDAAKILLLEEKIRVLVEEKEHMQYKVIESKKKVGILNGKLEQLKEELDEYKQRVKNYKAQVEKEKQRWKEEVRWNEEQSIQMQEERNRIRQYMQELRVQIAQAMTGNLNKDHLDSVAKAVSLDASICSHLPRLMASDIAAEMMAHDANNDDDVLMDPIDSSVISATVNSSPDKKQQPDTTLSSIDKTTRSSLIDETDNDMQHPQVQSHARSLEKVAYDSNNQAGSSSNADIVYDRSSRRGETLQHLQAKYPPTITRKSHAQISGKSRLPDSVDENQSLKVMKDTQGDMDEQPRKRKQPLHTKDTNTREMISKVKRRFGDKRSNCREVE